MIIEKKLIINNRKKADVVVDLRRLEFRAFPRKVKPKTAGDPDQAGEEAEVEDDKDDVTGSAGDYDYLLGMGELISFCSKIISCMESEFLGSFGWFLAISRLTAEQVAKLLAERDEKERELQILLGKTAQMLWQVDLDAFEAEWTVSLGFLGFILSCFCYLFF